MPTSLAMDLSARASWAVLRPGLLAGDPADDPRTPPSCAGRHGRICEPTGRAPVGAGLGASAGAIVAISQRVGLTSFTETSRRLHGCWLPAWDGPDPCGGTAGRLDEPARPSSDTSSPIPEEDIVELNGIRLTIAASDRSRLCLTAAATVGVRRWPTDSAMHDRPAAPRSPSDAEARSIGHPDRLEWADRPRISEPPPQDQKCRPIVAHAQPLVESAGEVGCTGSWSRAGCPRPCISMLPVDLGRGFFFLDLGWEFGCRDWGIHERRRLTHTRGWVVVERGVRRGGNTTPRLRTTRARPPGGRPEKTPCGRGRLSRPPHQGGPPRSRRAGPPDRRTDARQGRRAASARPGWMSAPRGAVTVWGKCTRPRARSCGLFFPFSPTRWTITTPRGPGRG